MQESCAQGAELAPGGEGAGVWQVGELVWGGGRQESHLSPLISDKERQNLEFVLIFSVLLRLVSLLYTLPSPLEW